MSQLTPAEQKALELSENPLLKRSNRMPGENIRLPSRGKFYKEGEVLVGHDNGEINIRPITLTDEIMMKSPDMIMQGTAIDHTFKRCSPNIVSPLDLVMPDVNFILTHLRRISLGPELNLHFNCQHCKHKQDVDIPLDYFTQTSKELEDSDIAEVYSYTTTSDNYFVELRPVTLRDFLSMQDFSIDMLDDTDRYSAYIRRSFISIIKSVEGVTDRKHIEEWIDTLPIKDIKAISKKISTIQGIGPKFEFKTKCTKCKKSNDLSTEINPTSFFIEPLDQETQN